MAKLEKSIIINCPINEVFAYVSDCRNSKGYLGRTFHFEAVTPPPYGVGTKAVAIGEFLNFNIRLNYVMTEFINERRMKLEARDQVLNGIKVDSEAIWRFAERGPNRTAISFELAIEPNREVMRGIGWLVAKPIIHTAEISVGQMLERAMFRLKDTLESQGRAMAS